MYNSLHDCASIAYSKYNRKLNCFCYFLTCILLSSAVYITATMYIGLAMKMDELQQDIIEIYEKLTGASKGKHHILTDDLQKTPCSEEWLNDAIEKYTIDLKYDLLEAKNILSELKNMKHENNLSNEYDNIENNGQPDYASESLGGQIEFVQDEPFSDSNFFLSIFGIRSLSNAPRNILNPSMVPGSCYGFKGTKSIIIIKLMDEVFVDSVTVAHISAKESPSGSLYSAPKDFSVYGLKNPKNKDDEFYFGSFMYDIRSRKTTQNFQFEKLSPKSYKYIKFHFTTNHGHPNYTCVYRVGVHGTLGTKMLN